jgi:hypothetical protein
MPERQQWEYNTFVFSRDGKKSDIDRCSTKLDPKAGSWVGIATKSQEVIFVFKRPVGWGRRP